MVLEKTPENHLDCEIKPINPKRNQSRVFIERIDAEAEATILWSHDMKIQLIGKDLDDRRNWKQMEKGAAEDEMVA